MLLTCSICHFCSIPLELQSPDSCFQLGPWISGNPDFRKSGNPDFRISGFSEIRKSGHPDFRKSGFSEIWTSGNPDIRISGYPDIPDMRISILNFARDVTFQSNWTGTQTLMSQHHLWVWQPWSQIVHLLFKLCLGCLQVLLVQLLGRSMHTWHN